VYLLRKYPQDLLPLFACMVIVEARHDWETDTIVYLAMSKFFEELSDEIAPRFTSVFFARKRTGL
jgi:hypothetical protein